jgi:hypothetical protein
MHFEFAIGSYFSFKRFAIAFPFLAKLEMKPNKYVRDSLYAS